MLEISLLGARAVVDGATGEVRSRSSRTLALVAYLARQAGTPQPRSRIAAAFWPASSEQQAHTNLRREIHQLRSALGDDRSLLVTTTDLTWCDVPTARVDLRVFQVARDRVLESRPGDVTVVEHGSAALSAFTGELLPGVYDEWVLAERERLVADCVEVCAVLSGAADRAGRPDLALAAARRRVELAPFEETGHRDLIRLHARRGDRAAAVSAYHRCAQLLDQELGVEPDAETKKLLAALVRAPGAASGRSNGALPAIGSVGLVARRPELEALGGAMTAAFAGSPRVVLLVGEPGVGKSRLAAEVARSARRADAVVATAHCYGMPGRMALAPVAEWLAEPRIAATVADLEPAWQAEVARLVPLPGAPAVGDGARGAVDPWQRPRFYRALVRALRPEARPLLLVLDDFQWCDAATLDLLELLVASAPTARLLLVLTARAAELHESREHADWLRRLRASGALHEVAVAPLGAADTGELLRRLTGRAVTAEVADAVVSTTGGFPLYVVEAARQGTGLDATERSPDLGAVLQARLGQLTDETTAVAGLAAAAGRPFDLELLCEASDLDADAVVRAVDELWRLRIVRETARGYDFTHDLLRTAAYEGVNPPRRWLLHRRLAQALEIVRAGRVDEVAAQLADQYSRAGNATRALDNYHRAAEVAARVFAHAEALRLHRAALRQLAALPEGRDRDLREVRTLTSMSASLNALRGYADPELSDALERLTVLAERLSLRETLVDALVGLWGSRFVRADMQASREIAAQAVAIADAATGTGTGTGTDEDTAALSGQAHFALAGASFGLGELADARRHLDLGLARSTDTQVLSIGSHVGIHARAWSAHTAWLLGDRGRASANAVDAVARARSLAHPYSLAIALAYAAVTWQLMGDRERLVQAAEEVEALGARHGFAYYPAWSLVLTGWADDDAAGTARIERGLADLRAAGAFARMPYWLGLLAERYADPQRARSVLDAAVVTARARGDRWWLPELLRKRALRFSNGSPAPGLREALAVAEAQGSATLAERCRRDLAAARTPGERSRS